ncbi:MAG: hypothetical protein MRK02_06235 [Candidatus Scalindua sp.]|nr:hypothetical protein [Candidatus Scalindua sp.]
MPIREFFKNELLKIKGGYLDMKTNLAMNVYIKSLEEQIKVLKAMATYPKKTKKKFKDLKGSWHTKMTLKEIKEYELTMKDAL